MIKQTKRAVGRWLRNRRLPNDIEKGWRVFQETGQTPRESFVALRQLHCATGGSSTDEWHEKVKQPLNANENSDAVVEGVLGQLSVNEVAEIAQVIARDGFWVSENRLDAETVSELMHWANTTPAEPYPRPADAPDKLIYDAANALSETYHFSETDLLANQAVQRLVADASFYAVAATYLRSLPIFDLVTMWWSAPRAGVASSEAAQLYHFDMDRVKWLKVFIYLTTVDSDNGPHCYLKGTHARNEKSRALLSLGDRRIGDEEIADLELKEQEVEITGAAGTIIIEDTRGHHKGRPPLQSDRLLLQIEFADSLFGASYEELTLTEVSSDLRDAMRKFPQSFSRLTLR